MMAFLTENSIDEIKQQIATDASVLGKLYQAKKKPYIEQSVVHKDLERYLNDGWENVKVLKTKCKIRKDKSHSKIFKDQIWCQFYDLGYRVLNSDKTLELPFSNKTLDKTSIDILAIDNETAFIIECESSEILKKAPSFKDEFNSLKVRIDGFKKAIQQTYGKNLKVQYIFATRNLRMTPDDVDITTLKHAGGFHLSDNNFEYISSLVKHYKKAANYQFLALIFKNKKINDDLIEIPAIEGKMGNKTYYMFSIEPNLLLKIGFILHRTKANDGEMPTYQRLIVPSRLPKITKFIDEGGFFPNSLIINFNETKKVIFESTYTTEHTDSRYGTLKIPNEYAIAYIIDGQHRLYGYANSKFLKTNTVPVVAMQGLNSTEQLSIFMDINQNQKAVSPSLRLVLEEDLFWDSPKLESRLKALKSSITKALATDQNGPLFNKITIGEDKALLTFTPFYTALTNCGLIPKAKGSAFIDDGLVNSLFDIDGQDNNEIMLKCKKDVVGFINLCYDYIEENFTTFYSSEKFILSNRGTYAFLMLIGSLNSFLTESNNVNKTTSIDGRFSEIEKYLKTLIDSLIKLSTDDKEKYLSMKGTGADRNWFKLFQTLVNRDFKDYNPSDLIDWRERQDKSLQIKAKHLADDIERTVKTTVIKNLEEIFGEEWALEITEIQIKCHELASKENAERRKNGNPKRAEWTEMLTILNYKKIIEKFWTKKPSSSEIKTFARLFSIDIGEGFNSKADKTKWLLHLNDFRKTIAHSGTKNEGLNQDEVKVLEKIKNLLVINM